MHTTQIIAYAAILFICIPAMLKNWTAVGLFGSFLIGQVWWQSLHLPQPTYLGILCDYLVLIVIFLKAGPFECMEIDDLPGDDWWTKGRIAWRRARLCFGELSRSDKLIASLFPPAWAASVIGITDVQRFWILWFIGLLQLFAAGAEAFAVWRRGRASASSEAHPADWFPRQRYAVDER